MNEPNERRQIIADVAIAILARDGLRALTHRAVDHEAGLPPGSSSYYVRTRRDLLTLVVHRLAGRTRADFAAAGGAIAEQEGPIESSIEDVVADIVSVLERIASRADDQRARFALVVELRDDPELHALLTNASPIQAGMLSAARRALEGLGVRDVDRHARGLVAIADGLLHDRLVGVGADPATRADARAVFRAYLTGLPR